MSFDEGVSISLRFTSTAWENALPKGDLVRFLCGFLRNFSRDTGHSQVRLHSLSCLWFFPAAVSDEAVLICANVTLVVSSEVSIFHGNICWQMFCIKVASLAYTSKTSFSEDSRLTGYCLALESIGVFDPGGEAE